MFPEYGGIFLAMVNLEAVNQLVSFVCRQPVQQEVL